MKHSTSQRWPLVCAVLAASLFSTLPAYAQSSTTGTTQVITDEESNTVTIVVGGKPVVLIDAEGLHVAGDISNSGTFTDDGGHYFRSVLEGDKASQTDGTTDAK